MTFATPGVQLNDLSDRHVVVWGEGREGTAAVEVITKHAPPASLTVIVDGDVPEASTALSSGSEQGRIALAKAEIVVKSPGVSPYFGAFNELVVEAGKTITGGTALWFAQTGGERCVGITGSKGKSTSSSLLHHVLTVLGERTVLAGNIGRAPIEVLGEELDRLRNVALDLPVDPAPERWVFELSSFQSAEVSGGPEHGILTSLFPEHLNWHGTVDRYYADKMNLFAHPTTSLVANMANADVARLVGDRPHTYQFGIDGTIRSDDRRVVTADGELLVDLADTQLLGAHNASNVAGVLATIEAMGYDLHEHTELLRLALVHFAPLAHRLQPVALLDERLVVDDSLSTAPQAAAAALEAFRDHPVAIIVGGYDRGLDYAPLAQACAARTQPTWVLCVPQSGERLIALINDAVTAAGATHVHVEGFEDADGPVGSLGLVDAFDAAVQRANEVTPKKGVILLSPGAPSFGRFKDYRDRGMHFRRVLGIPVPEEFR
jgi:UDP-N-acetylmuramoyl-L-alanine---L-glutamate ligase